MTPATEQAIRAHAVAEYPRECCGLVVIQKGRERYLPCRNIAPSAEAHFAMSGEDYHQAEDAGEIVALVHSHPDMPAAPSEADRVSCETSGHPWIIVSVMSGVAGELAAIEPCGYQAPLVGRPFVHGVLDCYTLVRDWHAREAGIVLPEFMRHDGWWNDGHSSLYLDNFRNAGCDPITGSPRCGDIILMQIRSKNGVPNHAGIYLGDELILHHLYGRLSSRDLYPGYLRDCTTLIVRHKDLR